MTVDVVIVTYNRLEKLKKAIACYEGQTRTFRNLIVVNNHSTDGTYEYLESWKRCESPFSKLVINTDDNLGGAGGFHIGQKKAHELAADWVFLADDDAYVKPDMMERFYEYAEKNDSCHLAAICGTVYHIDGTIDLSHRSRYIRKGKRFVYRNSSTIEDYEKPEFTIDFLSYVGSFINCRALSKAGFVDPRFFIYWDDSEHSLRLKRFGEIKCVPSIGVIHDDMNSKPSGSVSSKVIEVSWKDYYSERNRVVLLIRHFPWVALHQLRISLLKRLKGEWGKDAYAIVKWNAIKDAWSGRMGMHKLYRPGWEITR